MIIISLKGKNMNIAFFLTPKNEVVYENLDATMRQVMERMEHHGYTAIPRRIKHKSVQISASIESLISLAVSQNFVPVTDDNGTFIGIIKRSDIINHCYNGMKQNQL